MKITVETEVKAPRESVWNSWLQPDDITQWKFADESWHCPWAEVDAVVGGKMRSRMEAKDGSEGFEFEVSFTRVEPQKLLHYVMDDGREVEVVFTKTATGTKVVETFDAENVYPPEMQQAGWQSILNNFKKYVESKTS